MLPQARLRTSRRKAASRPSPREWLANPILRPSASQAMPLDLTAASFDAHASRSDIPLLVDFRAGWCGPCRRIAPAFAAAARQFEPNLRLAKLDIEAGQGSAGRHGIRSIPTTIFFSKGGEVARGVSLVTEGRMI